MPADAAQARDALGDLLRHQLAAEAGLRSLRDVDLDAVGLAHDVHVPAEPAAEALDDDALGCRAHPPESGPPRPSCRRYRQAGGLGQRDLRRLR